MYSNTTCLNIKLILLCAGLLLSCARPQDEVITAELPETLGLPYYKSPDFEPYWYDSKTDLLQQNQHRLGTFSFINQDDRIITDKDVKGKVHVANFFFTTCKSICPIMNSQFECLQEAFKKENELLLLSYSVDPLKDTPEALNAYANEHHAIKGKWHFLTGEKKHLYELARKFYFAERVEGYSKNPDEFLHTENFILVDKEGYIRGIYSGTLPEETARLISDIKALMDESKSYASATANF